MLMLASGQVESQKLLASDEPSSFLEQSRDEVCQSKGCDLSLRANGVCDSSCDYWQCYYDGGDCKLARCYAGGCTQEQLDNEVCDKVCQTDDCRWDNGVCLRF